MVENSLENLCVKLREILYRAVSRNLGESILLSGGLDSSIIALLASKLEDLKSITVGLMDTPMPDLGYAKTVADFLGIELKSYIFTLSEFLEAVQSTVGILKTFDPMEVRNSSAIYIALRRARDLGWRSVMTGDGSDELFAGYSFLYRLDYETMDEKLREIWRGMYFSTRMLGEAVRIDVRQPYLDRELRDFAESLDSRFRIGYKDGKLYGKYILRIAFEEDLPEEIVWREKVPIEGGCGTTFIPRIFEEKLSDHEFEERRKKYLTEDNVRIRSKEQLFYYEIYRELFGPPKPAGPGERRCPMCGSRVPEGRNYCRVCGAYPV